VYSRELLNGIARHHPEQRFLFCYRSHRLLSSLAVPRSGNVGWALLRKSGVLPWRCGLFHALNQRVDAKFAPTVATFHDLFVMTGDYSSAEFRARFTAQAREAAARSDLIIAVSEFTGAQVENLLGVDPGRIRVVRHGVRLCRSTPPMDSERENMILHVGAIQKRKNIARLVEAFETLPDGWRLVLAGPADGYGAAEIIAWIDRSPKRQYIQLTGYLPDEDLENLYRRARIFAFPSLDEGFGMPVLDAMARGVPVLTSTRSALPEVAGDAAMLADPEDSGDLAHGLQLLMGSIGLREEYRRKGLERAGEFSWNKAIESIWSVYRELAGNSVPP
jgi:glycosyltransferase involved in cell wall biosynthesis